jgi:hypothetical protein
MWGIELPTHTYAAFRGRGPSMMGSVARGIVHLGALLAVFGLLTAVYMMFKAQRGVEVLATIETAAYQSTSVTSPGMLDLSWRDAQGSQRTEYGVKISPSLARKLKIGRQLSRQSVRIRYAPTEPGTVIVVEDIPELLNGAAIIAMLGFGAISVGSLLMLAALGWDNRRRKELTLVRTDQSGLRS